jgi:hypothetical protein
MSANGSSKAGWFYYPEQLSEDEGIPPFYEVTHVIPEHDSFRHDTFLFYEPDCMFVSDCSCDPDYDNLEDGSLMVIHNCKDPELPNE